MGTMFIKKVLQMLFISAYLSFLSFNIFAGEYEISKEHEKAFDPIVAQKEIQFKKNAPFYNPKQWDPQESYLNKIPQDSKGVFIDRKGNNLIKISPVEAFGKNHSLGFNGTFVKVTASHPQIDGILILPTSKEKSGSIDVRRSYIFRWDDKSKKFFKMPRSGVSQDGKYVWARITSPGDYTVIGLNKYPKIQAAIHSICASADLSPKNLQSVRKLCKEKFCGDANFPTGSPSLPIDPSLNDICQKCPNLEGIRMPECDLAHIPFPHLYLHKWESLGPFNIAGVTTRIELDPNNPDRLYALADPGGLWVLDDVTAYPEKTWRPLTDEQEKIDAVRLQTFTLGTDGDNTIVYLVDMLNNLHKSKDGGNNWDNLGTIATLSTSETRRVKKIIVNPHNHKVLYAATLSGLFVSRSGGLDWEGSPIRSGQIFDAVIDFDDTPETPIIYTISPAEGVFKRNRQDQWECIFDQNQLDIASDNVQGEADSFHNPDPQNVYDTLCIDIGEKNKDGSLQTDKDRVVAVMVYTERTVNGISAYSGTVYSKRNNENDWKRKGWKSNIMGSKKVLSISPHNSDLLIMGNISLWQSDDGGDTWNRLENPPHADNLCAAFDPRKYHEKVVYVSTDGGVYRSSDGGINYDDLNQGLVTTPIFRAGVNGNFVLGTIDHWGWWGSSDVNAGIWSGLPLGHEWYPVYADPKPEQQSRFYGFGGSHLHRIDYNNGQFESKQISNFQPWTRVATRSVVGAIAVDPRNNSNTILVGAAFPDDHQLCPSASQFRMMMTSNGDMDSCLCDGRLLLPCWSPARCNSDPCDPIAAIAYDPSESGQAYMMTYNGHTYRSIDVDGGQSFNEIGRWDLGSACYPNNATSGVRQIAINNEGDLFAISQCRDINLIHDCNKIAFYDKGRKTWNPINPVGLPDTIYHSLLADSHDSETLYLSTQNGVYISYDSGVTWERWDNGLPNVEIMQLLKDGDRIYAVTYGRGLWYRFSGTW